MHDFEQLSSFFFNFRNYFFNFLESRNFGLFAVSVNTVVMLNVMRDGFPVLQGLVRTLNVTAAVTLKGIEVPVFLQLQIFVQKSKFALFRNDIGNGLYPATGHAQAAGN